MKNFPPAETLIELEPEEIGELLLVYLNDLVKERGLNKFHRYNETNPYNEVIKGYAGDLNLKVSDVLSEAWMWLVSEGFLAPLADENSNDWVRVSRRGLKIQGAGDLRTYEHLKLLPKGALDPVLSQKVWAIFIRGDFSTAIFSAFKEVEIRIKKIAKIPHNTFGVAAARQAFHPERGLLTDYGNPDMGERQAYADLFAGALGILKNPLSHRDVNYDDPIVATSCLMFANYLLKIVEERKESAAAIEAEDRKIQASAS